MLGRRTLLQGTLAGGVGAITRTGLGATAASRCNERTATDDRTRKLASAQPRILLAFFSRAGENYFYGDRTDLEVGNTEVLAGMIRDLIACDVYRIEPTDPYPWDYEETVQLNVREQDVDARPAIANPLDSIDGYDIVLLGSPIWNVRAPMIMSTFAESFDFAGKTIHPFTTHAMSGLGTIERDYAASCSGATIGEGLAVQGEEVANGAAAAEAWLQRIRLLTA